MKRHIGLIISLVSFTLLLLHFMIPTQDSSAAGENVYIIPVEKEVEKGLLAVIDRGITEAEDNLADHIVLEINTPGGAVDAAADIAERIRKTEIPITAYITNKALSAGAYISLNADQIVMNPQSTMGSAAIITSSGNAADKKAQSYWLTEMKIAAEFNDRDPKYALAMADESIELPELNVGTDELLTLSAGQALEVGYAEALASSRVELFEFLGIENPTIHEVEVSFAEKIARLITHPIVVPILLSIGSLGLVMELYSPGFGVPGFMGLTALALFFYGHIVAELAGIEAIILLVVGIVFIVLEMFLPGGIMGLIGVASIIFSLLLSSNNIWQMGISILIAFIVTVVGSIILFKVVGLEKGFFKHIILKDSTSTEKGYLSAKERPELVGMKGKTLSPLRPSGTAMFGDERLDVVTEGSFINEGKTIIVIKSSGSRIVVREIEEQNNE